MTSDVPDLSFLDSLGDDVFVAADPSGARSASSSGRARNPAPAQTHASAGAMSSTTNAAASAVSGAPSSVPPARPPPSSSSSSSLSSSSSSSRHQSKRSYANHRRPMSFAEAFASVPIPSSLQSQAVPSVRVRQQRNNVPLQKPNTEHRIIVSKRQDGNPVLKQLHGWEFGAIIPDYVCGQYTCALYLSLRYAKQHPQYLHARMGELVHQYKTRVLLCVVDVEDYEHILRQLTKIAFINRWSLVCCWSTSEVVRYLETLRSFENKSADLIKDRVDSDPKVQFGKILLKIKSVNKTDVATLASTFGSLSAIISASMEELALCPGLGQKKVRRIYDAFHGSFLPRAPTLLPSTGAPKLSDEIFTE